MNTSAELPGLTTADALASLTPADADRFRLVVIPDDEPSNPLDDGGVTVVDLLSRWQGGNTPTSGTDPIGLRSAVARFSERLPDDDHISAAAIRWAAVFHGVAVQRWQPQGSVQSAWGDGLAYFDDEDMRAEALSPQGDMLRSALASGDAWYRGEVYGVRFERLVDADLFGDAWETVEEVWGHYLTRDYTAAHAAADIYGVPLDFAQALPVVER